MATVEFANGRRVEFEGTPTPEDIDYVASQLGITPENQDVQPKTPSSGVLGTVGQVGVGALKGLGSSLQLAGQLGESITGQTVGRIGQAIKGRGFVPTPPEERMYSPESAIGQRISRAVEPTGTAQKVGFYGEKAAEFVTPFGVARRLTAPSEAARTLAEVTPKLTAKGIREAYRQGRTEVSGLLGRVGITPTARTERAARAVEGVIKPGATIAENTKRTLSAIGDEAKTLRTALRSRDVQPIVDPTDVNGLYQKVLQEIGENPDIVIEGEKGKRFADLLIKRFQNALPKGRDITAEDILDARQSLDKFAEASQGAKIFDETEKIKGIVLRTFRQSANDLIASKAPDVAVKESLARQSAMYDALSNLITKAPAEAGTTATGRFLGSRPFLREVVKGTLQNVIPLGIGGYLFGRAVDRE